MSDETDDTPLVLCWTLQSKAGVQEMWVCEAGFVHRLGERIECGLWGQYGRVPVDTIKAGQEKIEEQYWPDYMKLLEAGLSGAEGTCVQCKQDGWGTPQEKGGILCMSCQRRYRRDLR